MDIRKLQRAIVDGLEDVKGQHITVFNTEHLSSMFERVIIASGTSNRQTKALAASVRNSVKGRGMQVMATEGEDNGEWIIVDCGAAVAHIMQPAIREYYHLEEIWGGKPVRIAKADTSTKLVKASEPVDEPAVRTPVRSTASTTARKATAPKNKVTTRSPQSAAPAKPRPAAKSNATKKAEGEQKVANRTAAFKRVAAKSAPARAGAAAKAPASRETRAPANKTIVVKPSSKPVTKPAGKPSHKPSNKPPAKVAAKPASRPAAKRPATAKKAPTRKPTPRA